MKRASHEIQELAQGLGSDDNFPKLSQFRRINDTTISWIDQPRYKSPRCTVFIELRFDDADVPLFFLTANSCGYAIYRTGAEERNLSPQDALDGFVDVLRQGLKQKNTYNGVWAKYGM